ncbi:MAG: hypothetical protein DWI29_01060 [Planctomycetota bacterium]|nr:MAG: hypothetical protein DWI29_01060 [Planctomycetota bacterium]
MLHVRKTTVISAPVQSNIQEEQYRLLTVSNQSGERDKPTRGSYLPRVGASAHWAPLRRILTDENASTGFRGPDVVPSNAGEAIVLSRITDLKLPALHSG